MGICVVRCKFLDFLGVTPLSGSVESQPEKKGRQFVATR